MIPTDDILTPEEVERFTGLPQDSYIAQRNFLRAEGIRCLVNARKEVIVTWSWIRAASNAPLREDEDRALSTPNREALRQVQGGKR